MRIVYRSSAIFAIFLIFLSPLIKVTGFFIGEENGEVFFEALEQKIPLRDRIYLAWQQEYERTADPASGIVPRERLHKAWQYERTLLAQRSLNKAAIPGVSWQERGPNNCGGRTRTLLVDMNDATKKTVWAGSAGGGLWKTTDITQSSPNWVASDDFFQNLAVMHIDQAPGNPQVMYFCTGEGNGNLDAVRGLGVWKSINGGSTWTHLTATSNSSYYYCQKVVSLGNGDTVFIATKSGMYRSVNGGTSFTKVLGSGISSAAGDICYDIERMSNGTMYATMSNGTAGSIHKSFNHGMNWSIPLTVPSYVLKNQMEIAISASDTNIIYALVEHASRIKSIIKSVNAGNSWDTVASHPIDADGGVSVAGVNIKDFSRGQAWYDLSLAVDPNNANVCIVGGVDLFRTVNGGNSWTQLSHWYGGFGYQEVHADQHYACFEPGSSSVCYFTNDGGVYRSGNFTATSPVIASRSNNYNTTQFYACDIHPTASGNQYVAGTQDNGSHRFTNAGVSSTTEVTGGDGAFCHIDQNEPNFWFTSYVYTSYYRSTNGGTTFSNVLNVPGSVGSFISPTDYDDINNRMYLCGNAGTYQRWNNPQTGNSITTITVSAFNSGKITHVKVSPNTSNRVYFGLSNGRIVRVDNAHLATPTELHMNSGAGMPSGSVSCIEVETGNDDHLLVTYSNYGVVSVWETKNGGTSWAAIEGNLPDMPIRWALFNPNKSWQAMLATELGVWTTDSIAGTVTNWQPSNNAFANVRTDMLKLRASDKQVVAATHGRGLFTSNVFAQPYADFYANKRVVYIGSPVTFTSTSNGANIYSWNFGDSTTSSLQNPVKQYTTAGIYNVTLTINGGAYSKTINTYIQVLPFRPVPYSTSAGGDFESNPGDFGSENVNGTAFVRGNSSTSGKNGTASGSFAWVTGLSGNYTDNCEARLYSPNFNCTANGVYTIKFKVKNKFEISYDGYIVEYSLNLGNTWTKLGTSVQTNWYDFANTSNVTAFPTNEPFFNVTRSAYTQMQYVFTPLAGNDKVCFRIVFKSDQGVTDVGMAIDDFEITGPNNSSLPASLIAFNGTRIDESVILNWAIASEQNNKGFWLQRSTDGVLFENIAFVPGHGNSSTVKRYRYTDMDAPAQKLYYRLKQEDYDNDFEYSPITSVDAGVKKSQLQVMTLPQSKTFAVNIPDASLKARLISQTGAVLEDVQLEQGFNTLEFRSYSPGIYLLEFYVGDNRVQVEKIFLIE